MCNFTVTTKEVTFLRERTILTILKIFLDLQGTLFGLLHSPATAGLVLPFDQHGHSTSARYVVNLEEAQFGTDLSVQINSKLHHRRVVVEGNSECQRLSLKLNGVVCTISLVLMQAMPSFPSISRKPIR